MLVCFFFGVVLHLVSGADVVAEMRLSGWSTIDASMRLIGGGRGLMIMMGVDGVDGYDDDCDD